MVLVSVKLWINERDGDDARSGIEKFCFTFNVMFPIMCRKSMNLGETDTAEFNRRDIFHQDRQHAFEKSPTQCASLM